MEIERTQMTNQGPVSAIVARFVQIPITNIQRCELLCDYFEEGAPSVVIGNQELHPAGMLKNVTAKITFLSPVLLDPRCLIAKLPRSTTVASRTTRVEIGVMDTTGEMARHSTGNWVDLHQFYVQSGTFSQHQYSVEVPLIFSRLIQPSQMPLVDRIETKKHYVMHYTLNVPGRIWPGHREIDYKIRIKLVQTLPLAQVVSISTSFIDTKRFEEAWGNFKDWVSDGFKSLSRKKEEEEEAHSQQEGDVHHHLMGGAEDHDHDDEHDDEKVDQQRNPFQGQGQVDLVQAQPTSYFDGMYFSTPQPQYQPLSTTSSS